jgi:hypothetical protein
MQKTQIKNCWKWLAGMAALFALAFNTKAVDPFY